MRTKVLEIFLQRYSTSVSRSATTKRNRQLTLSETQKTAIVEVLNSAEDAESLGKEFRSSRTFARLLIGTRVQFGGRFNSFEDFDQVEGAKPADFRKLYENILAAKNLSDGENLAEMEQGVRLPLGRLWTPAPTQNSLKPDDLICGLHFDHSRLRYSLVKINPPTEPKLCRFVESRELVFNQDLSKPDLPNYYAALRPLMHCKNIAGR